MPEQATAKQLDSRTLNSRMGIVIDYLDSIILGKTDVIRQVMVALLSKGHLLIEDVPGVGKTTLARSLAGILECRFQRISFTSDMMPSDILGVSMFNRNDNSFTFQKGPVFTNILLADELNRTTPKTQSAFLEAMESGQVTVETTTHSLPEPFMVMATQNPLEFSGTFPLPISQLDRFLMRIEIGYPSPEFEEKILVQYRGTETPDGEVQTIPIEEVVEWQKLVPQVRVEPSLVTYITQLALKTRDRRDIQLGVSPRAALGLQRSAQARALLEARDYVTPDDIQEMIVPVWSHRVVMANQSGVGTQAYQQASEAIEQIVAETPVPV
jgi:MoxR-like ATPase